MFIYICRRWTCHTGRTETVNEDVQGLRQQCTSSLQRHQQCNGELWPYSHPDHGYGNITLQ